MTGGRWAVGCTGMRSYWLAPLISCCTVSLVMEPHGRVSGSCHFSPLIEEPYMFWLANAPSGAESFHLGSVLS
jgi:hypothetical protein